MKHFFKYKFGYINIDEENLYLTKTGNWQEVKDIIARNNKNKEDKKPNTIFQIFSYILVLFNIAVFLYTLVYTPEYIITTLITVLVLDSITFIFRRRDFGKQCIIPLNCITAIEILKNNKVKINYTKNGNNPDYVTLKRVEEKGIEFLKNLKFKQ